MFSALGADAPVSAVADRAGVGIGTLYRRFGSKAELLQRLCVLAMEQGVAAADDALGAGDAWTGLAGYVRACVELRSGALAALAGQIETTAQMRAVARRSMTRLAEIVARAHRDGSLRPDVTALDVTWLIEQFSRRPPGPGRRRRGTQRPRPAGGHRPRRAPNAGRAAAANEADPSGPPARPRRLRAPAGPAGPRPMGSVIPQAADAL